MESHTDFQSFDGHRHLYPQYIETTASGATVCSTPVATQLRKAGSTNIITQVPLPDPFLYNDTYQAHYNTPFISLLNSQKPPFLLPKPPSISHPPTAIIESIIRDDLSPFSSLAPETPRKPLVPNNPSKGFEKQSESGNYPPIQIKVEQSTSTSPLSSNQLPNFGQLGYALVQKASVATRRVSFAETIKEESNNTSSLFTSNTLPYKIQASAPKSKISQTIVAPPKRSAKRNRKAFIKQSSSSPRAKSTRKFVRKQSTSPPPSQVYSRLRPSAKRAVRLLKLEDSLRKVENEKKHLILKLYVRPALLANLKSAGYIFPSLYNSVPKLFKENYPLPNRFYSKKVRRIRSSLVVVFAVKQSALLNLELTGSLYPLQLHLNVTPEYTYPLAYTTSDLIDHIYPGYFEKKMAPGYRTQNRRQNRGGYVDHDVLEGLPVRQWRRDYVTVAPPAEQESSKVQNDIWAVELPHGMPKDSHLLPQHSQDLLRAARSGRIYKRPAPVEEEDADPEVIEKPEKKEDDTKETGFSARAWKQIPRQQEGPDLEYLAKRRKGLITYTKPLPPVPTVVKTTVRRTDAAGNQYTQDVVVPHGQQVDGEVVAQTVIPDPSLAPPPETFGVQPTPPKRNRPIQKKRPKGPGRGRKKKPVVPSSAPQAVPIDGQAPVEGAASANVGPDGIKTEPEDPSNQGNTINEDTEMGEGSNASSDGEEDGEEGDDDDGSITDQTSPSKAPKTISPTPTPLPTMDAMQDIISNSSLAPPVNPLIAKLENEKTFDTKSGSPLKNVALATSALASPIVSPVVSAPPQFPENSTPILPPPTTTLAESEAIVESLQAERADIDHAMQMEVVQSAPTALPSPPPAPAQAELLASEVVRKEEEEEEEMLLDIVENNNTFAEKEAQEEPPTHVTETVKPVSPNLATSVETVEEPELSVADTKEEVEVAPSRPDPTPVEEIKRESPPVLENDPPMAPEPDTTVEAGDDDDDFPDLLGGLEKSLGQSAPPVSPPSVAEETPKTELPVDDAVLQEEEKKADEA
ncbi:hypothetical protein GLAREA_12152 [Glarea lozoyensis ATCC 20868]|uniref:Uncharacterized protein n=1 Tax=Glarea lozoyensis (strain ATCC 20868 / MF5171) TaxID=1116229 RepID=S3D2L5_GLAL2|nr:uncharacterized protein GLAREA_12152 [Glarea lozoyensis ATCC 20868]EPE32070.1 hypothetical protein GLAREA_12152 [Glarea lozoyensis ATCC 20868]